MMEEECLRRRSRSFMEAADVMDVMVAFVVSKIKNPLLQQQHNHKPPRATPQKKIMCGVKWGCALCTRCGGGWCGKGE